jgi:hypothetical protein
MKKYLVHGGMVISQHDGDKHFISADKGEKRDIGEIVYISKGVRTKTFTGLCIVSSVV